MVVLGLEASSGSTSAEASELGDHQGASLGPWSRLGPWARRVEKGLGDHQIQTPRLARLASFELHKPETGLRGENYARALALASCLKLMLHPDAQLPILEFAERVALRPLTEPGAVGRGVSLQFE
jgi:hypothetical protein